MNQAWVRAVVQPASALARASTSLLVQQLRSVQTQRKLINTQRQTVILYTKRVCSTGSSGKDADGGNKAPRMAAPEEFYDPEVERQEELNDFMNAKLQGSFQYLTATHESSDELDVEGELDLKDINLSNLDEYAKAAGQAESKDFFAEMEAVLHGTGASQNKMPPPSAFIDEMMDVALNPLVENKTETGNGRMSLDADALAAMQQELEDDDEEEYEEPLVVPKGQAKTRIPFAQSPDSMDPTFKSLLRKYDPQRYGNEPGTMPCKGGKQRTGTRRLSCHVIDLEQLHHTNTLELSRFLDEDGMIQGRSDTRLCARCQRKVAKTIKRARQVGFVPHIGQFAMTDDKALNPHEPLHKLADAASDSVLSKTM